GSENGQNAATSDGDREFFEETGFGHGNQQLHYRNGCIAVYNFRSGYIRFSRMVYVRRAVYILVEKEIYIEYGDRKCLRSLYAFDRVGGCRLCLSYRSDCFIHYLIHLANTSHICNCDAQI